MSNITVKTVRKQSVSATRVGLAVGYLLVVLALSGIASLVVLIWRWILGA